MSLVSKVRVLAAKIETTPGTAVSLSGSDAVFNVFDPVINPTAPFTTRTGQGAFGSIKGVVGETTGQVTFKTELYGDGAGGVPTWASTLFPACGLVNSGGTFSLRSEAPGASVKTLTIGCYEQGRLKMLRGAVGSFVMTIKPGQLITLDWTFMGAWVTPTDAAILTPTHNTQLPMRAASGLTTIGSFSPCYSQMTLDLGNVMTPRTCIGQDGGVHSYMITDRSIVGTLDPESKLVATEAPYTDWYDSTERALEIVITDSDDEITFAAPKLQFSNVQEGDRSGLMIDTINYQLNRTSNNDELTISFAAA